MKYVHCNANLSPCGLYRWSLVRQWGIGQPLVWIMLNPSTADAMADDPTIRRVVAFSDREGYAGCLVVNLWGLRATDPKDLHARRAAFEPENMEAVRRHVNMMDVVVAWGNNAPRLCPAMTHVHGILQSARSVRCLGVTKSGQPRHPVRLRNDEPFVPWTAEAKQ